GRQEESRAAEGGPQVRPVHPRQRREGLPGPRPRWAPRRHESNPIRRKERWYEHSQRRDAEVSRSRRECRRHGGPVMRKTWVLAGAAVLVAVAATVGVVVMSSAKQATPAAPEPPANTVKVEKGTLSA